MITLETVIAFALRDPQVMDQLGEALRNDLVLANPYQRRIVDFADEFLLDRHKLPGNGDWSAWLDTLPTGAIRDGTRETLGQLMALRLDEYDPGYFSEVALEQLRRAATQVARARINESPIIEPTMFSELADKIESVQPSGLRGLAELHDIETWTRSQINEPRIPTGFPTLDKFIGGWGKELWMIFADAKMGKSMLLQNFATAAAIRGNRVLHVTLELGLRPQIHRYYRAIAEVTPAEMVHDPDAVKKSLRHWFRFAKGSVHLLEYPAFSIDHDQLKRTIERTNRTIGNVDVLVLDYLDLVSVPTHKRGRGGMYEDLGRLTHEVRAYCPTFDMTVLTASQAVRKPAKKDRLSARDMGDSYNKVRGVDGLLYLVQSDDEREIHQGRIGIVIARDAGGAGREISVYINRELSVIAELNHPNTVQLMSRLGHLPTQQKSGTP